MEAGDEILRVMAKKTAQVLTEDEAMCRLEGDHFAILRCIRDEETLRREYKEVVSSLHTFLRSRDKKILSGYMAVFMFSLLPTMRRSMLIT